MRSGLKKCAETSEESAWRIGLKKKTYSNIRGVIFIWQKRKNIIYIALWSLCDKDTPSRAIGRVMFYLESYDLL